MIGVRDLFACARRCCPVCQIYEVGRDILVRTNAFLCSLNVNFPLKWCENVISGGGGERISGESVIFVVQKAKGGFPAPSLFL